MIQAVDAGLRDGVNMLRQGTNLFSNPNFNVNGVTNQTNNGNNTNGNNGNGSDAKFEPSMPGMCFKRDF